MDIYKLVEQLLKLGAVIAVFGYVILRAHINYLGFSSMGQFQPDRYLMEFYQFIGTFVFTLANLAVRLVLIYFLYLVIESVFRGRPRYLVLKGRITTWTKSIFYHSTITHIVLLLYCLLLIDVLQYVLLWIGTTDVLVGPLQKTNLSYHDRSGQFTLLCGVVGLGCLFYWVKKHEGAKHIGWSERISLRLLSFLLIALVLSLPVVYGLRVRPPTYPHVSIESKEARHLDGNLIMEDSATVCVWEVALQPINGTPVWCGGVTSMEKSEIHSMTLSKVENLFDVACKAISAPIAPPSIPSK